MYRRENHTDQRYDQQLLARAGAGRSCRASRAPGGPNLCVPLTLATVRHDTHAFRSGHATHTPLPYLPFLPKSIPVGHQHGHPLLQPLAVGARVALPHMRRMQMILAIGGGGGGGF